MTRQSGRRLVLALAFAVSACRGQGHFAEPAPVSRNEFTTALSLASDEVIAGRYGAADRVLSDFSTRFPASSESVEAVYWRALYKLDPANQSPSAKEAVALLDSYLMSAAIAHRPEAVTLKRIAAAQEARVGAPGTSAPARPEVVAPDKTKDDEITRLKDELAKANAELERIRRRLAQPSRP